MGTSASTMIFSICVHSSISKRFHLLSTTHLASLAFIYPASPTACPTALCTMPSTRQRNTVLAAAATASAGALTFVAPPSTGSAARVEPGVASSHAAAQPQTSMGATTVGAALLAAGCAARMTPKGKGQRKAVKLAAVSTDTDVETDCINSIRFLAVDAVNKANSGHPGAPMGQAPIGYLLFAEEMAYNPKDPAWVNRDRFVLSSGHGCMLQYSLLHLAGYDSVAMDDLKQFRQWGSKTPGHPENFETDGIEAHMAAAYNKPDFTLIDHYTYTIAGDGCMQERYPKPQSDHALSFPQDREGISHEACAYAGHLGLGKLIAFYDDNGITIDGHTDLSFTEDVGKRFEAYGWQVITVSDGDKEPQQRDVGAIRKAIAEAKACTDKPTLIKVKTTIGFGSPNKADSHDAHGAPLGADEAEATRKQLGWGYGEFEVPEHVYAAFKKQADAGSAKQAEWDKMFAAYKEHQPRSASTSEFCHIGCLISGRAYGEKEPELAAQFERAVLKRTLPDNWDECLPKLTTEDKGKATRLHSQDAGLLMLLPQSQIPNLSLSQAAEASRIQISHVSNVNKVAFEDCLNAIAPVLPEFMGGSADLAPSNMTLMTLGLAEAEDRLVDFAGRVPVYEREGFWAVRFRGLCVGIIPYCATFTIFTDYMRSAIRIAALSQAGTIFVTTHDSIAVGEDGPTHQPIETLPSLRLIPDLTVMRPADGNETAGAYKYAVERSKNESRPTMMAFSRQALPNIPNSSIENTLKGAYEVLECEDPEVIIVGTGSEVHICLEAGKSMDAKVRVVSMPSVEESLLPKGVPTLSVEAAVTSGWGEFSTAQVGINCFGASAPGGTCLEKFGFTAPCPYRRVSREREIVRGEVPEGSQGSVFQLAKLTIISASFQLGPSQPIYDSDRIMPSTRQRNTVLAAAATASAGALTFVAPPSTPSAARIEPGVAAGHVTASQPQTSMGAATVGAAMLAAGCATRATAKGKGQRKAVKLAAVSTDTEVETDCINSIRFLAVDAVNKANSGHPGAPMGQAPIGYLLFAEEMAYNPKDPTWVNRDRFVLSSGHGCMLQYSLLHLAGYDSVAMDDLKQFRQWGSKTPGHPENFETQAVETAGIEVTTGPLGMGISNAVGLAAAEAHMAATYNKPDFTLIDHYTYTIAGDGCMQERWGNPFHPPSRQWLDPLARLDRDLMWEGISHEACAYAGHLGLGKLIAFYDDNGITIDGHTDLSFTEERSSHSMRRREDVGKRFEAYGWQVLVVDNGDQDVGAIRKAIAEAKACTDKPTLIKVKTTIGFGSPNKADSHDAHGAPLGADEAEATRKQLGWSYGEFEVPEHVYAAFKKQADAGIEKQGEWDKLFAAYKEKEPELAAQFERAVLNRKLPDNWEECLPKLTPEDNGKATRLHSQDCLNAIAPVLPEFMGGSADLAPSNMTLMKCTGDFLKDSYSERNFRFGIREFGMGAVCNALSLDKTGIIPYCATFTIFTDYMRSAIRIAALSQAGTIFVTTHDSIAVSDLGFTVCKSLSGIFERDAVLAWRAVFLLLAALYA
eukprot:s3626_g3.t1